MHFTTGVLFKRSLTFGVEPPVQRRFLGGEEEQYGHNDDTGDCIRDVPVGQQQLDHWQRKMINRYSTVV